MTRRIAGIPGCDDEPIRTPGGIQPHGIMLVVDVESLRITHVAGDIEGRLGVHDWEDAPLHLLIGELMAARVASLLEPFGVGGFLGQLTSIHGEALDVSAQHGLAHLIVELEPGSAERVPTSFVLDALASGAADFERAADVQALCQQAAAAFRALTRFDRVMVYRFREDGTGVVVAEDAGAGMPSFLHQHFPASDIPKQARELYLRNRIRVIPDRSYQAAMLRPAWTEAAPLDMTDAALRSVSPVHLLYLSNMDVQASASISIARNGVLWGLIACHHHTRRALSYDIRAACRSLAGSMGRQIKAKEDMQGYRQGLRLRGSEDDIIGVLQRSQGFDEALSERLFDIGMMMTADGVALLRGETLLTSGSCPTDAQIRSLVIWLRAQRREKVFATDHLSAHYPPAHAFTRCGSGLLAMTIVGDEPWMLLCFRLEQTQTVTWAGNPDKAQPGGGEDLTPRASFAAWEETVRGRSQPWMLQEEDAALRLCAALLDVRRTRYGRDVADRILLLVRDKAVLLEQNAMLLTEISRGVQQTVQLITTILALPSGRDDRARLETDLEQAHMRLRLIALVPPREE